MYLIRSVIWKEITILMLKGWAVPVNVFIFHLVYNILILKYHNDPRLLKSAGRNGQFWPLVACYIGI